MRSFFFFLVLLFTGFALRADIPGYTEVKDLQKFQRQFGQAAAGTKSIRSDFTQEKNLSMLSEKIVSKGRFWFKKDNMVRMEYKQPFQYLLVINKDKVYMKDGNRENKISTRSNKIFQQVNRITVDCVQGTVLSNPDFKTRVYESRANYLIELSPAAKGLKDFFKTIQVIVEKKDYSVASILMTENSGDNTLISFTSKELNPVLPDALFIIK